MKQALMHTAVRLPRDDRSIFEQGQGMLNLSAAAIYLDTYTPRVTIVPPALDTTDCPYMWPYCTQGLYHSAQPLVANLTILNGLGAVGHIDGAITWHPDPAAHGELLDVAAEPSAVLWPWSGNLAVRVAVRREGRHRTVSAGGELRFAVVSPPAAGEGEPRRASVVLPVRVQIIPTPPRTRRLLWDQFHSLAYPPGYIPRDDLSQRADPLDWNGDHPHTNFRTLFRYLRRAGYFLEVLSAPWTCFQPRDYAALLLVDPEEEIFAEEAAQLRRAVADEGLSLLVVADWYSERAMAAVRFFDDNTRNWWFPETGGSNVPALNELLAPWGMAFAGRVLNGKFSFRDTVVQYRSGTALASFPAGGRLVSAMLADQGDTLEGAHRSSSSEVERVPVIGLYAVPPAHAADNSGDRGPGRVALYGDSSCLDDAHASGMPRCMALVESLLGYLGGQDEEAHVAPLLDAAQALTFPLVSAPEMLPDRSPQATLHLYSAVLDQTGGGRRRPLPVCPSTAWAPPRQWRETNERSKPSGAEGLAPTPAAVGLEKRLAPPPPGVPRPTSADRFLLRADGGLPWATRLRALLISPGGLLMVAGLVLFIYSQWGRRSRAVTRTMRPSTPRSPSPVV